MLRISTIAFASLLLCMHQQSVVVAALEVGDQLCIQGFVMDYFCIQNVNMIDNGLVTLEQPDRHTVHCLVDVGICLNSAFEVLIASELGGSTSYSRGYRLDEESKSDIINLARSVGSCSTCVNGYDGSMLNRGFKAVMKVTVLNMNPNNSEGAPPLVRVDERKDSSRLGNDPCQSEYGMVEGVPASAPTNNPPTLAPVNPPTTPPPSMGPTPTPTSTNPTKAPATPQTPAPDASVTPPPPTSAADTTTTPSVTSPTMSPNVSTPSGEEELADSATGTNLLWSFVVSAVGLMVAMMM